MDMYGPPPLLPPASPGRPSNSFHIIVAMCSTAGSFANQPDRARLSPNHIILEHVYH